MEGQGNEWDRAACCKRHRVDKSGWEKEVPKKEYSLALSFDYICDIFLFIINLCCPEFNAEIIKHNFLIAILNSTILFPLSIWFISNSFSVV